MSEEKLRVNPRDAIARAELAYYRAMLGQEGEAQRQLARALDEGTNIPVALTTERAEGVLLRGAATSTSPTTILSRGHSLSFRVDTCIIPQSADIRPIV